MFLGLLLSSLEFVQTPVGDLDDPVTVNHTSSGGQVAMEFNSRVMEVLHSLEEGHNKQRVCIREYHQVICRWCKATKVKLADETLSAVKNWSIVLENWKYIVLFIILLRTGNQFSADKKKTSLLFDLLKEVQKLWNRLFARTGHMVRYKLCWNVNNAVGLSKQRNSYQSSPTFLCFKSPTALFASKRNLFRIMWPDRAKGL